MACLLCGAVPGVSSVPNTYLRVLRVPGGRSLLGLGSVARVGMGMAPLALILATLDAGGDLSRRGSGGRRVRRRRCCCRTGGRSPGRPVGRAAGAGCDGGRVRRGGGRCRRRLARRAHCGGGCLRRGGRDVSALTAVLRGSWAALGRDDPELATLRAPALSLDAATFELVFVVGPVLVSVATAVASADEALYAVAAVTLLGTLALLPNPALPRRPICGCEASGVTARACWTRPASRPWSACPARWHRFWRGHGRCDRLRRRLPGRAGSGGRATRGVGWWICARGLSTRHIHHRVGSPVDLRSC